MQVGAKLDREEHKHREHRDDEPQTETAERVVRLLLLSLPADADCRKFDLEHRCKPSFQFLRDLPRGQGRSRVDVGRQRDRPLLCQSVDLRIAAGHLRIGQFPQRAGDAIGAIHPHIIERGEAAPLFAGISDHQFHLVTAPLQPHHLFAIEARPDRRSDVGQRHSQRLGLRLDFHLVFPLAWPGIVVDINDTRILGQPPLHPLDGGLQLPHRIGVRRRKQFEFDRLAGRSDIFRGKNHAVRPGHRAGRLAPLAQKLVAGDAAVDGVFEFHAHRPHVAAAEF